jgi:hypothetical protein
VDRRPPALSAAVAALVGLTLALSGCTVDTRGAGGVQRTVLLGPDFLARAAAETTSDPQAQWLLRQPGGVRSSYVHEVIDRKGDRTLLSTAWLLRQPDPVQESYARDVVEPQLKRGP